MVYVSPNSSRNSRPNHYISVKCFFENGYWITTLKKQKLFSRSQAKLLSLDSQISLHQIFKKMVSFGLFSANLSETQISQRIMLHLGASKNKLKYYSIFQYLPKKFKIPPQLFLLALLDEKSLLLRSRRCCSRKCS